MSITKTVSIAKQQFLRVRYKKRILIKAKYRSEFDQKQEEELPDDFYCWYYINYVKRPKSFAVFSITTPDEKQVCFNELRIRPLDIVDEDGGCDDGEEEEADFWAVYGRRVNGELFCIADCDIEKTAIALEQELMTQLRSLKLKDKEETDDFEFTPQELIRAMALSIYEMLNVETLFVC